MEEKHTHPATRARGAVFLSLLICGACASNGGPGLQGAAEATLYSNLSGDWVLNAEESTDLAEVFREAMSERRRRGPGGGAAGGIGRGGRGGGQVGARGGGGQRGGRQRGQGGASQGGAQGQPRQPPPSMENLQPAETLAVVVVRNSFGVGGGMLNTFEVSINGKTVALPRRGREMEVKAKWDGPTLLVERKVEDGPKIVDRYASGDGTRLLVTRKIELPRGQKLEMLLVYDRPDDDGPGPAQGPGPKTFTPLYVWQ